MYAARWCMWSNHKKGFIFSMRFPCSVVYISIMHLLWYRQFMLLQSKPFAKYLITKFDEFYLVATEWRQYGILTTRTNESKNEQKPPKNWQQTTLLFQLEIKQWIVRTVSKQGFNVKTLRQFNFVWWRSVKAKFKVMPFNCWQNAEHYVFKTQIESATTHTNVSDAVQVCI